MVLYEIQLPNRSNGGLVDYASARRQWGDVVLDVAGGFSYRGRVTGCWKGSDKVYEETMHVYHVAVPVEGEERWVELLIERAFELFPDQEAIYVAKIGTVSIVGNTRP